MVERLARFLSLCYSQIMNLHKWLCQLGLDSPTDIYNDEQYENLSNFASFCENKQGWDTVPIVLWLRRPQPIFEECFRKL